MSDWGTCAAPSTVLRFEPDGRVSACCVNSQFALGHADSQSIREIWEGERVRRLRRAIAAGDFSLGCQDCKAAHEAGRRLDTEAGSFDRLVGEDLGRWPRRLEFALSNACNLQCVMCNGELSSAIRAHREGRPPLSSRYPESFFEELAEFLPHLSETAFLGGEPFLSTEVMRVWDLMIETGCTADVHVTTNGTQLNDRVERYLSTLRMNVAVSIDGASAETFEAIRVGADFARTMSNLERISEITHGVGRTLVLNHCIMTSNWRDLPDVLVLAERLGATLSPIVVVYPRPWSLSALPGAEIRRIVAALEQRDAEMERTLTHNLAVWHSTLRRLGSLSGGGESVTVHLGGRRPPASRGERLATELFGSVDLLVRIEATDDVIDRIVDRDWATPFGFGELAGTSILRLLPTLARRARFDPSIVTESHGEGLTVAHITGIGASDVELHSVMVEWDEPDTRRSVLLIGGPGSLRVAQRA